MAMEYKDLLEYVSITLEKQKVELDDNINRDARLLILVMKESHRLSLMRL